MSIYVERGSWPEEAVFAPSDEFFRYRIYGLTVFSGVRLGLSEETEERSPSVLIEVGGSGFFASLCGNVEMAPDDGSWYRYAFLPDGSVYLRWEGLFHFWISADGKRMVCGSLGAQTMESLQTYLLGHSLGFALVNQGEEPLHATVVALKGRTVALVGPCGSGKSTLASYVLRCGGRMLTDDLLRLDFVGDQAIAHPGPNRIKLFPEPVGLFMNGASLEAEMSMGSGKFIISLDAGHVASKAIPLDALVELSWPVSGETHLERLTGKEAFLTVIAAAFNTRVQTTARLARQCRFAEAICSRVPVYRIRYPRDFSILPQVRKLIWTEANGESL